MAHYALLGDPAACSRLIMNKRLASGLLTAVAARGSRDSKWVSGIQQDGPEPPDRQLPACVNGDAKALWYRLSRQGSCLFWLCKGVGLLRVLPAGGPEVVSAGAVSSAV
jgi:hypothetical protein